MRRRPLPELLRDTRIGAIVTAQLIATALGTALVGLRQFLLWMIVVFIKWTVVFGRFDQVEPIAGVHTPPLQVAQWLLLVPVDLAFAYLLAAWIYAPRPKLETTKVAEHTIPPATA